MVVPLVQHLDKILVPSPDTLPPASCGYWDHANLAPYCVYIVWLVVYALRRCSSINPVADLRLTPTLWLIPPLSECIIYPLPPQSVSRAPPSYLVLASVRLPSDWNPLYMRYQSPWGWGFPGWSSPRWLNIVSQHRKSYRVKVVGWVGRKALKVEKEYFKTIKLWLCNHPTYYNLIYQRARECSAFIST